MKKNFENIMFFLSNCGCTMTILYFYAFMPFMLISFFLASNFKLDISWILLLFLSIAYILRCIGGDDFWYLIELDKICIATSFYVFPLEYSSTKNIEMHTIVFGLILILTIILNLLLNFSKRSK